MKKNPFDVTKLLPLLFFDVVGMLLLGLGVHDKFGASPLLPDAYRFNQYELIFIAIGIAFMAPIAVYIVKVIGSAGSVEKM